jgi:hypothetical protein
VGVAAIGRRAPALRRGPIPGPSARENAVESRLSVGAREKSWLVKECEREERGAVLRFGGDSTRGSKLAC